MSTPYLLTTDRLQLRPLSDNEIDSRIILDVLTDPDFVQFVGDRGVRTQEQARGYIRRVYLPMAAANGVGSLVCVLKPSTLDALEKKAEETAVGICGIFSRSEYPHPDLGFAFLRAFQRQGLAYEAARGVVAYARAKFRSHSLSPRLLALVNRENCRSLYLLQKLGFQPILSSSDSSSVSSSSDCVLVLELEASCF
jgi:RimJ/RimL family protein N-acetyltransferase